MHILFLLQIAFISCDKFKINSLFDICYVNLERESLRKNHMESLLSTVYCRFSRFNAVDGIDLLENKKSISYYLDPLGLSNIPINISKYSGIDKQLMGMVGCKLSHYINFRRIEKSNSAKPVLVLEDDIDLEADFVDIIEGAIKRAPKDWDIITLTEHYAVDGKKTSLNTPYLHRIGWFVETIYLVNGARSSKMIADLIELKCSRDCPIDTFLSNESIANTIQAYAFKEKLAIQLRSTFPSAIPNSDPLYPKPLKRSILSVMAKRQKLNN